MAVVVITPPVPVIAVPDAQAALGISGDDFYLAALIAAAQQLIDGPAGTLGRSIGAQTLELREPAWGGHMERRRGLSDILARDPGYYHPNWRLWSDCLPVYLPFPPVTSVVSVKYLDQTGIDQTADPSTYTVFQDGDRWRIEPLFGTVWPAAQLSTDSIRIRYEAGYGTIPAPVRHAILLMVRNFYVMGRRDMFLRSENVQGVGSQSFDTGAAAGAVMNNAVEALLAPYRIPSL